MKKKIDNGYLPKVLGSGRSLWSHGRQEEEREGREGKLGNHVKTSCEERELKVVVLWREQPLVVKRKGRRTRVPMQCAQTSFSHLPVNQVTLDDDT